MGVRLNAHEQWATLEAAHTGTVVAVDDGRGGR